MFIRERTDVDLAACEDIAEQVHAIDGYPVYLPGDLRSFIASTAALGAWVAEHDGAIVGHVALHSTSSAPVMTVASEFLGQPPERLGVVARLFVSPTARRLGTGRLLLEAAWQDALARGRWPILDVVTQLEGAIELYETCGWVRAGEVTLALPDGREVREFVYVGPTAP